jgi:hypothetical protein
MKNKKICVINGNCSTCKWKGKTEDVTDNNILFYFWDLSKKEQPCQMGKELSPPANRVCTEYFNGLSEGGKKEIKQKMRIAG